MSICSRIRVLFWILLIITNQEQLEHRGVEGKKKEDLACFNVLSKLGSKIAQEIGRGWVLESDENQPRDHSKLKAFLEKG